MKPDPHQQSGGSSEEDDKLEEAIAFFYSYHRAMHGPDFTAAGTPQILNPNYSMPAKKPHPEELDHTFFAKIFKNSVEGWVEDIDVGLQLENDRKEIFKGNDKVLSHIVRRAVRYTELLFKLAERNPELLKPYAETRATWPMPTTTSPGTNKSNVAILKAIGLGQASISEPARHYKVDNHTTREAEDLIRFAHILFEIHCITGRIDWDKLLGDKGQQQTKPDSPPELNIGRTKIPKIPTKQEMIEANKKRLTQKWLAPLNRVWAKASSQGSKKGGITPESAIVNGVIPELSVRSFDVWKKFLKLVWLEAYDGKPELNAELRGCYPPEEGGNPARRPSDGKQYEISLKIRDDLWTRIMRSIRNQISRRMEKETIKTSKPLSATNQAPPTRQGGNKRDQA
jgi:hypothetical protein